MSDAPENLTEEERAELEARQAMRRGMRHAGMAGAMLLLVGVVFMATLQSVVLRGMTPGALYIPITLYLLTGLALSRRGRWGLSLFCLFGLILHLTLIPRSAETLAQKRAERAREAAPNP